MSVLPSPCGQCDCFFCCLGVYAAYACLVIKYTDITTQKFCENAKKSV